MLVKQSVIDAMNTKGFKMVEGAASLKDYVVVELRHPYSSTRILHLKTQEAVEVFNKECSGAWGVFRKQLPQSESKV